VWSYELAHVMVLAPVPTNVTIPPSR
jgi:hypothetical protein